MLESLSQALQSMQSQVVDQKSLAAALGTLQGFQSTESTSSVTVNTLPVPGVTQQVVKNTGNVDKSGNSLPDTSQTTTTTTQNAVTPQPPSLDNAPAFSGFNPNYGESATDLFSDQVNLSYQIFNLRMILERSLSDRLQGHDTRLQTVLGFNVTIDPPRTANDAAAVVEITLTAGNGDLSLVALMPQEKTYNSATLSTKSNSFGGSAVVKMIQVGYSQRRRGQTFYLYRDNDTISYERMDPAKPSQIIFGWVFRPVLGRRSVSPGLRQLFAIASLPATDSCTADELEVKAQKCSPQQLNARVRTLWKKYDRRTLTSFEKRDTNRAARFKYATTFGLSEPELFNARYINEADYGNVTVETTAVYQQNLGPRVTKVSWVPVGPKTALVSVVGNNFFPGTQVRLGDKAYASLIDGLMLKSNQALDLSTPLDSLASGSAAIIGRYGPAVPLSMNDAGAKTGVLLAQTDIGPSLSGLRTLTLHLTGADPSIAGQPLSLGDLPHDSGPLVSVNGNTVPLPYAIEKVVDLGPLGPVDHVIVRGAIPDSFLAGGSGTVRISWPFLGDRWTSTVHFSDPGSAYQAVRTTDKSVLLISKNLAGFTHDPNDPSKSLSSAACWRVFAADKPLKLKTELCASGDPETEPAGRNAEAIILKEAIPDKIVLVDPYGASFPIDVPKLASSDTGKKPISLNQYDAVWIEIPLDDVAKASTVEANLLKLKYVAKLPAKPGEKSKAIKVEVTRELTAKPGNVDITVFDKDGKSVATVRVQIACVECKSDGGK